MARYYDKKSGMKQGSGMIKDDLSAPSNLPRELMDKEWPSYAPLMHDEIPDLFMGVQKQMSRDHDDLKKAMNPKKY